MFNIKPYVFEKLAEVVGEDNVSDLYPFEFGGFPYITYYEQYNGDLFKINREVYTEIIIQVDIFHNRSTSDLAQQVNEKMGELGFKREFARDIPDPSGIKHKTMRFRVVVNNDTGQVYN